MKETRRILFLIQQLWRWLPAVHYIRAFKVASLAWDICSDMEGVEQFHWKIWWMWNWVGEKFSYPVLVEAFCCCCWGIQGRDFYLPSKWWLLIQCNSGKLGSGNVDWCHIIMILLLLWYKNAVGSKRPDDCPKLLFVQKTYICTPTAFFLFECSFYLFDVPPCQ